jgi:CheY-like chemotaxis protein
MIGTMIVAVVDDLLFSSKIRSVADQAACPITFVRHADAVLTEVRDKRPRLVIVDLDRASLDPIGAVRALKAHPEVRETRIVGFVSHVHADKIAAAREAGIDVVLARSAFVAALPKLVAEAAGITRKAE